MNRNIDLNKPDLNIVKSLKEIKWPLRNKEGTFVFLSKDRFEHIAIKRHFLKVRDIKILHVVLLNPIKVIDCDYRKNKIYFGKRRGNKGNDNMPYLQIVTKVIRDKEHIITIYPRNNTNEKLPN